jgi:hypothetical protein
MRRFPKARTRIQTTEWGFYHRLCREQFPGLTVSEMLERLSTDELLGWMAWTEINDKEAQKEAAQRNSRR